METPRLQPFCNCLSSYRNQSFSGSAPCRLGRPEDRAGRARTSGARAAYPCSTLEQPFLHDDDIARLQDHVRRSALADVGYGIVVA